MQIRTMFINALSIVQMYDDKDALLRTIQIDESPEEVFAEIVALVTSKTADEILPYIHSVTHRVIGLIKDLIEAECGGDISDEVRAINKKHTDALKEFISLTNNPALTIVGLIHNGLTVGYPFLLYANTIGRKLEEMTPEYAAQELYAMALASQDGCDNPQAIIIDNLENFISGIEHTTKIMNIVSAYQIQLQRNTQNG
jgi:L-cysteine desulfidase